MQHLVRKIQHLSNYTHPVAVLGQMNCQAKASVQNSLYCSWSRNSNGPPMETIFCAYCTTVCHRLMICHRFTAFKRLFMNPLRKRAYGLRGAAEHLWSCSPVVGYLSITEKKLACLWPLITYPACELTEVRVSMIICMGLCRCVFIKETGLGREDGLSVARHGWGAFPFSGTVLWVLQHSHFIPLGSRPFVLEA